MDKNSIFHNRYTLEKLLGRGAYSEVWLAQDVKTNVNFALKIFAPSTSLDDDCLDMFAREFSLVVGANGENILKPLYYDSFDGKPYIVLPYCSQGSTKKRIGKTTEEEAWMIIHDVASGLKALHSMTPPIIHQDIKPENIMITDDNHYLISDFGVSTHLHSTLRRTASVNFQSAGTHAYMGPERFSSHKTPVMASDIYSLGATIYELLTGDTPFGDEGGLLQKSGADIPELEGEYSVELKNILTKCLSMKPWERPTTDDLIEICSKPHSQAKADDMKDNSDKEIDNSNDSTVLSSGITSVSHNWNEIALWAATICSGLALGIICAII